MELFYVRAACQGHDLKIMEMFYVRATCQRHDVQIMELFYVLATCQRHDVQIMELFYSLYFNCSSIILSTLLSQLSETFKAGIR
jgi:hypothetical protein